MTRYVIKRNEEWAVVNANYKRSIKMFATQHDAIVFASELLDTKSIIVQGQDHKFRKISSWDLQKVKAKAPQVIEKVTKVVTYVPSYVQKYISVDEYKSRMKNYILIAVIFAAAAVAITFAALFGVEVHHYA